MTHREDLVERPADGGAQSKCLEAAFSEEAECPAEILLSYTEKSRRSQRERDLKQQEGFACVSWHGRKAACCFWVWRSEQGPELDVVVREEIAGRDTTWSHAGAY